jgi:hypothetical protein
MSWMLNRTDRSMSNGVIAVKVKGANPSFLSITLHEGAWSTQIQVSNGEGGSTISGPRCVVWASASALDAWPRRKVLGRRPLEEIREAMIFLGESNLLLPVVKYGDSVLIN